MRKPVKTAAVLFGLGVGLVVGPSLGAVAVWLGVAVAALGIGLSLIGTAESDLVGDGLVDRDEPAGRPATDRQRAPRASPNDSGGTRTDPHSPIWDPGSSRSSNSPRSRPTTTSTPRSSTPRRS